MTTISVQQGQAQKKLAWLTSSSETNVSSARQDLGIGLLIHTLGSFSYTTSNSGSGSSGYAAPQLWVSTGTTSSSRGSVRNGANSLGIPGASGPGLWSFDIPIRIDLSLSRSSLSLNAGYRLTFGRTATAGAPTDKCFGIVIDRDSSNMYIRSYIHDGISPSTSLISTTALNGFVHRLSIIQRGDGNYIFIVNSSSILDVSAPTLTGNAPGHYFWSEVENNADSSDSYFGIFSLNMSLL